MLMATRCTIAVQDAPDRFRTISCSMDGYPAGVGVHLLKYYNTPERIEKLLALGNLISIGANLDKSGIVYSPGENQSICEPHQANAQDECPWREYNSLDDFFNHSEVACVLNDYIYLYRDGKWYADVPFHHYGWHPLQEVAEADCKEKDFIMSARCQSRLYVVCKKTLNSEPIDIGHSMLSVGHSVAIAFNEWEGDYAFERWRHESFRKIVCQASETEFDSVKEKLRELNIDFKVCGEVHFGPDAELALVVFPLEKEKTPKCLQYLQPWGRK